jgi:hypothetical protein
MKMKGYTSLLSSWSGLSGALFIALITTIALFASSCRTLRHSLSESAKESALDSLSTQIRLIQTIPIPAQAATLEIPTRNLLELPPKAVFTAKAGRASVSASITGDTIYIHALCDSLQQLCQYYESEIVRIRSDTEARTVVETMTETSTDIFSPIKLLLAGFVVGIVSTIIFLLIIKLKK